MKVFISHSLDDRRLALDFDRQLESQLKLVKPSATVWSAAKHFFPGENWGRALSDALQTSHAMVALVTPDYLHSEWCLNDVNYAINDDRYRNRVFVVMARRVRKLEGVLHHFEPIDITGGAADEKEGIKKIVYALLESKEARRKHAAPAYA